MIFYENVVHKFLKFRNINFKMHEHLYHYVYKTCFDYFYLQILQTFTNSETPLYTMSIPVSLCLTYKILLSKTKNLFEKIVFQRFLLLCKLLALLVNSISQYLCFTQRNCNVYSLCLLYQRHFR